MDESEDSRQNRRADLSQSRGVGFGHTGEQGDGHLNKGKLQVDSTTTCFMCPTMSAGNILF